MKRVVHIQPIYYVEMLYRHIKKTWIPTVVVPHHEACALPVSLEQQREAHAEYISSLCQILICTPIYAYKYAQTMHHNGT